MHVLLYLEKKNDGSVVEKIRKNIPYFPPKFFCIFFLKKIFLYSIKGHFLTNQMVPLFIELCSYSIQRFIYVMGITLCVMFDRIVKCWTLLHSGFVYF